MMTHKERVAVVSGAASGIGQELAVKLAERGASLVLLDLVGSKETAERISAVGGEVLDLHVDVASAEDWERAATEARRRFGRTDILVNNAGIYPFAEFDDLDYSMWSKVHRVNLDGPFLGAKTFAPLMAENGWGRIVNLSSDSIGTNLVGLSHYMAAKMGVIGLTRGFANELADRGITVNAVAPAITKTAGTSVMPQELIDSVWSAQAIKRFADPSDIVGPILFLTSDDAGFVTGQTIVVDGGMLKL